MFSLRKWWPLPVALAVGLAAGRQSARPETTEAQPESPAQALSRLAAEAREELRAAEEQYAAARAAEAVALPQEERDFRWLYPPSAWHHGAQIWHYHGGE